MITGWIVAVVAVLGILTGIARLLVLTGRLVQRVDDMDERLRRLEAKRPPQRRSPRVVPKPSD